MGIIGWSHGGLITLMNIFQHPQAYAVAYAGVPVSDLVARMGYESEGYRAAVFGAVSHRQNGARGYSGVPAPLAVFSREANCRRRC